MVSKFKNSKNVYLTRALFFEFVFNDEDKERVLYTLQEEDRYEDVTNSEGVICKKHYPSVYRLFLSCDDPTGYQFASQYLGSWYHYEQLMKNPWFKTVIDRALLELEVKTRSRALTNIVKEAGDKNSKSQFQANKYLLEKGWIERSSSVGRPTKEKIQEEANKLLKDQTEVDDDFNRLVN